MYIIDSITAYDAAYRPRITPAEQQTDWMNDGIYIRPL